MSRLELKNKTSFRRKNKVRAKLKKQLNKPRLSVVISNRHVYAQIIDDTNSQTLAAATSLGTTSKGSLVEIAKAVGEDIALKAKAKKLKEVKFDRGAKLYHGRVKAFAEKAREEGLKF